MTIGTVTQSHNLHGCKLFTPYFAVLHEFEPPFFSHQFHLISVSSCFYSVLEIDVTSRFNQVFWLGDFNFRVDERHGVVVKLLEQYEEDDDPNYEVNKIFKLSELLDLGGNLLYLY